MSDLESEKNGLLQMSEAARLEHILSIRSRRREGLRIASYRAPRQKKLTKKDAALIARLSVDECRELLEMIECQSA